MTIHEQPVPHPYACKMGELPSTTLVMKMNFILMDQGQSYGTDGPRSKVLD